MPTDPFPWVNPWRRELNLLLSSLPVRRKSALRRSLQPDFLFAVDLPACAEAPVCQQFLLAAAAVGWQGAESQGWINLRREDGALPEGLFPLDLAGEAGCLHSLMDRHPELRPTEGQWIAIIKAREEGPAAWEQACRLIHQDWARRLREKPANCS
ncbi:MAG: hypothetical protein IJ153_00800 [Clostridia bacterium]|nr:hypothetical protein [Clostridia bacterium]